MTIYGISGLGADERVFQHLELSYPIVPIRWIPPMPGESMQSYVLRLSEQIREEEFMLIGVSFGGLVAVELNKILKPKLTILISSAETKDGLRPAYRLIGKLGLVRYMPPLLLKPPKALMYWLFGAEHKELLGAILGSTDIAFAKWAILQLTSWTNREKITGLVKIHGTRDKLIPYTADSQTIAIQDGEHFMIIDRAKEISLLLEEKVNMMTGQSS
ncbi:alpha/beta hydrolase [Cesiribacter sp. SM1]|uniref:alpha/beta hydrolase n=1 Tax=Cesiribacter sp. SM1 TaxID=2861196 RepID=UPI001CD2F4BF|nr:alpha/beta hydrolase [Cesiribacter sp. SM1]